MLTSAAFKTEASSRQIIDLVQHQIVSMLAIDGIPLITGTEVTLEAAKGQPWVFSDDTNGAKLKTQARGKLDYVNFVSSRMVERELQGSGQPEATGFRRTAESSNWGVAPSGWRGWLGSFYFLRFLSLVNCIAI